MTRPAHARINLAHLRYNYSLLREKAGGVEFIAVVKADAYGHGMSEVVVALMGEGCRHFAVTDAVAGAQLRRVVESTDHDIDISLLSGVFDKDDADLCRRYDLTPVLTERAQLEWLHSAEFQGNIWLKFNSGMNRMGADEPRHLFEASKEMGMNICGLMSHLACADHPEHSMNRLQVESFVAICKTIDPLLPRSLLNSAGLLSMPVYSFDSVRLGIALYGAEPIATQPVGLKPVMSLIGGVIQVRVVQAGDAVSYGATFVANRATTLAVISLGYADGVPRQLSGAGSVFIRGHIYPIVGRVCMDYSMIDVSGSDVKNGDHAEFWGEHVLANDVADLAGTISYTLFTGVGDRVQRIYE